MAVVNLGQGRLMGLSTDTKLTTYPAGTTFLETDTGVTYVYIGGVWHSPTYPSKTRIFGVRQGFISGVTVAAAGTGLFSTVTAANGTGIAVASGTDTTDGARMNHTTGTNNTFARAGWWGSAIAARKLNPTLTVRYRLGAAQTAANAMLYIGFINVTAQPTAGTSMLSTMLDTKIGVLFGFRAADTTWMIMSNNAQATATYTACTGLPNSGATDATAHTISITLDEATPAIRWSFDGALQTAITDTTNNVPPQTTALNAIMMLEAQSATDISIKERWSHFSTDIP